jgi:CubicO group peptidase (beta-lactamase class C family)
MPTRSSLDPVWSLLDSQVASGRFPGYAAAVRRSGSMEVHVGGTTTVHGDTSVLAGTIFAIASLSKLVGGALALELVRDGAFGLDDPVSRWLPELDRPRVLRRPTAELTDTEPLGRPVLVRDLLTFTAGIGFVFEDCPLSRAMRERGLEPGSAVDFSGDELMARLAELPLACQPGRRWLYHTPSDVVGVLMARATGRRLAQVLQERITGPLGMTSTAFHAVDPGRLAASYTPGPTGLVAPESTGTYLTPPPFESLGGGLLSTIEDYAVFLAALASPSPVVSRDTVRLMTTDGQTDETRADLQALMGPGTSWGMGTGLDLEPARPWMAPGRFWWNGGSGTTAAVDPAADVSAVLFTLRAMQSATGDFDDFWRTLYASL